MENFSTLLLISLGLGISIVLLLGVFAKSSPQPIYIKAMKNGSLFTPIEWRFYKYLHSNLPDGYALFGKVRVSDLILPRKDLSKKRWGRAFSEITCKHIDFVVVDMGSGTAKVAVELNDSSHNAPERRKRDLFLKRAFKEADLPLVFVPLRSGRKWDLEACSEIYRLINEKKETEEGEK